MSFDISRLRRTDQIIGGGAIALFIFLFFFKWYGASASSSAGGLSIGGSLNGWHSFTNSRWIWLITIVVALGVVAATAAQRELDSPVQLSVVVAGLGALSALLILYRIVHHPSASASGGVGLTHFSYSYGIKIGIWLGLIAAAVVTYGGYLAMQAEGTSLADVREQASGAFSGLATPSEGGSSAAPPAGGAAPTAPTAPTPPTATAATPPPSTSTPPFTPPPAPTPPTPPSTTPPFTPPPAPAPPESALSTPPRPTPPSAEPPLPPPAAPAGQEESSGGTTPPAGEDG
jgi:hypothetical protein